MKSCYPVFFRPANITPIPNSCLLLSLQAQSPSIYLSHDMSNVYVLLVVLVVLKHCTFPSKFCAFRKTFFTCDSSLNAFRVLQGKCSKASHKFFGTVSDRVYQLYVMNKLRYWCYLIVVLGNRHSRVIGTLEWSALNFLRTKKVRLVKINCRI